MTFEEWKATRTPCDDVGEYLGDAGTIGLPGFLYADFIFIVKSALGDYWTIAERDEKAGTLEECEVWLWDNFANRAMNNE